jgi:hypothetical protein
MRPIFGFGDEAMLDRVVMDVIHVTRPVPVIPDDMIVKPVLGQVQVSGDAVIFFIVVREIASKRLNKL